MPAANGRFHTSGAVTPQIILYQIACYYPVGSLHLAKPLKR